MSQSGASSSCISYHEDEFSVTKFVNYDDHNSQINYEILSDTPVSKMNSDSGQKIVRGGLI